MSDRKAEIAAGLAEVRERIAVACRAAGRKPDEVRLLVVTKTFPASDVALLSDLGMSEFAENRDQEARVKVVEFGELRPQVPARWHMVGSLQRNKAASVVRWASVVQSVDSTRLVDALQKATEISRGGGYRDDELDLLIQVSLDDDPARGGAPLAEVPALAEHIAGSRDLRLRGVMAVAPLGAEAGAAFQALAEVSDRVRRDHPFATEISAGMSGDVEAAILHGSTCVRVGTAVLGGRQLASP